MMSSQKFGYLKSPSVPLSSKQQKISFLSEVGLMTARFLNSTACHPAECRLPLNDFRNPTQQSRDHYKKLIFGCFAYPPSRHHSPALRCRAYSRCIRGWGWASGRPWTWPRRWSGRRSRSATSQAGPGAGDKCVVCRCKRTGWPIWSVKTSRWLRFGEV